MAKGKKIKRPKLNKKGKIPDKALQPKALSDNNDRAPVFSFKYASRTNCLLCDLEKDELTELVETLKRMESMPWKEVIRYSGFDYKSVPDLPYPLPSSLPDDVAVDQIRVTSRQRLFGYRAGRVFYLIWFDRVHQIRAEGKVRR